MVSSALSLESYQLKLPAFEGPLDVLLRLIERNQLDVSEVSLIAVFDQFIAYTRQLDEPPPQVVAEFVAVAGRLALLKSRALLPRPPRAVDDGDEPDLLHQLEEYRSVKAAAELLAERQRSGVGVFGRGPSIASPAPVTLEPMPQQPAALSRALGRWLSRRPARPTLVAPQPVVSVREMISRISSALHRRRQVSFAALRATCSSRQDVSVAFLALLLLIRRQAVVASQPVLFGPITLARADADSRIDPRQQPEHETLLHSGEPHGGQ